MNSIINEQNSKTEYDYFKIRRAIDKVTNYIDEIIFLSKIFCCNESLKIIKDFEQELKRTLTIYRSDRVNKNYYQYICIYIDVVEMSEKIISIVSEFKPKNKAKYDNKSL